MMDRVLLIVSLVSAAFLLLLGGALLAEFDLPPKWIASTAKRVVSDWIENGQAYLGIKPVHQLRPLRFEQTGMVTADDERSAPGVTLIVGMFGKTFAARLLDRDGSLLHEWPDLFSTIKDRMTFPFDGLVHGSWLYPNGDLIANMDDDGLVRLDACGRIVWQNHDRTHHAVFVDHAGFIWSPLRAERYQLPRIRDSFRFDRVGRFDPDTGELVETIDLVEIIVDAGLEGLLLASQPYDSDMMHLNDVEILSPEMAAAFPQFAAGDIMLSSRNLNQIWVLDGRTHRLKWWRIGPMDGAHDPDFQPDGTITVLDNRPGGPALAENGYLGTKGGSRIIRIDPQSQSYETVYASGDKSRFYTPYRGKHQMLDNGNILIAETDAGRVFEVAPDGSIVWSYVNRWDEDEVGWITGATRYPDAYRDIAAIACPGDS